MMKHAPLLVMIAMVFTAFYFMRSFLGRLEPGWSYGFMLLIIMATLAILFAAGEVTEATSFGLMPIVTALAGLLGAWANWAFRGKGKDE